jgi:hypothetical protein
METSQRNSLCSYLKQAKMPYFSFFFYKSENRRAEQVLPRLGVCVGLGITGRGEVMGKGWKRANMEQIQCTHGCKRKK